jgi:hypothetical protein
MLILFDHSTPAPLAPYLTGHTVTKAKDRGWDTLSNGDLLGEAERAGFDLLLTADNNMRYQQNLTGRKIALVVLSTPQWPRVQLHIDKITAVLNSVNPDAYAEIEIPYLPKA